MGVDFPDVGEFPLSDIWEGFPMALTDTEIRRSKPGDKPFKLSDGGGLHLMVTPSGGKLWRWKYRFEGAEKLMALGRYPEISLAEAHENRDAARKRLANGIDPMAERKAEKTAVMVVTEHSFEKIAEQRLEHWRGDKSARHAATTRNRLRANVYPVLGSRPIAEIEPTELVELAKGIETRGASDMATLLRSTLRSESVITLFTRIFWTKNLMEITPDLIDALRSYRRYAGSTGTAASIRHCSCSAWDNAHEMNACI
jgi:hypothetical protein